MKKMKLINLTIVLIALVTVSCKKPLGSFNADLTTAAVGEPITFTNSSEDASTSDWDFGDGSSSTSDRLVQTHVYTQPGTYTVSLIVATGNGNKPSEATPIEITIVGATASASASNTSPSVNEVVTFTSSSTNASEFAWDFGDGSALALTPTATHTFSVGGTYVVRLTAKDASGASVSTDSVSVVVSGGEGHSANLTKIVGAWTLTSIVAVDVRNGQTFTSTNTYQGSSSSYSYRSQAYSKTYTATTDAQTHEFSSTGDLLNTDAEGNTSISSNSINLIDASRMTYGFQSAYDAVSGNQDVATYVVTATSLVITYVSTNNSLSQYSTGSSSSTSSSYVNHPAGEKQVVTTTITYAK